MDQLTVSIIAIVVRVQWATVLAVPVVVIIIVIVRPASSITRRDVIIVIIIIKLRCIKLSQTERCERRVLPRDFAEIQLGKVRVAVRLENLSSHADLLLTFQ